MGSLTEIINRRQEISIRNSGSNSGIIAKEFNLNGDLYIGQSLPVKKFKSLIPNLIKELANITNKSDDEIERTYKVSQYELEEYNIEDKIEFNKVIKYKEFVDEYSQYYTICDEAFNVIDNNNVGSKKRILTSINQLYKQSKGEFLFNYRNSGKENIEIVRENADNIIEMIMRELELRIINDQSCDELHIEYIQDGLIRVICYAFVKCKILEKPS